MNKKHIIYVSTTLPTQGYGSSVIVYRHLRRLKSWKVSIVAFPQEKKAIFDLPEEWKIITIDEKKWWWPPLKYGLSASIHLRIKLLARECKPLFKNSKPDIILNHFGKNSILAYYLSKKEELPLCLILHDRYEVWAKKEIDKHMSRKVAIDILNHASLVWTVSKELANFYKIKSPEKISILPPIPEGKRDGFVEWRDDFVKIPVVAFAGSFHSHQLGYFRNIANILNNYRGKILIVSKKNDKIREALKDLMNIEYHEPFRKNEEVLFFLGKTASCVLIPDSIDPRAAGNALSFPSRLVEFSHLGLPMIIISQKGTALSNWAKRHGWIGYLESQDVQSFAEKIKMIMDKESWQKMAEQSRNVALGEFDPDRLQEQFEADLGKV